MNRYKLF